MISKPQKYSEFSVRADDGRILFRSKPWAYSTAAAFAAEHGGVIQVRDVERTETVTEWVEVNAESAEALLDAHVDDLHGPGAAAAVDEAVADGSIFGDSS